MTDERGREGPAESSARRRAGKIAAIYGVCGLLWITLSDRGLDALVTNSALLSRIQTYKGWFFICFTALLVFFLTRRALQEPERLSEQVRLSENRYRALFESTDAAVLLMHGPACVECNPATLKLFGLDSRDEIIGKTPLDFAPELQPDGTPSAEMVRKNIETTLRTGLHVFEWQANRKNGEPVFMEVRFTPYRMGDEQYFQCIAIDISTRKKADLALQASEAKFRRLYNETPIMLHSIDRNGVLVDVNDHWLRTMGYTRDEVIGRKVTDFYTQASRTYAVDVIQPAFFRDGAVREVPYQFVKKNGDIIDVLLSATAERDASGTAIRSQAVIEDITARKRAEAEVREHEMRYRALFDSANDGIFILDESGFIDCNRRGADMYGLTREQVIGRFPADLSPEFQPDARPTAEVVVERVRAAMNGASQTFEWQSLRSDGSRIDVEINLSRLELGGRVCLQALVRDITDRKKAVRALAESEKRLRTLIDAIPDAVFFKDAAGRHIIANSANETIYGLSPDMMLGKAVEDLLPADLAAVCRRNDDEVMKNRVAVRSEEYSIGRDGRECILDTVKVPLYGADGTPMGLVGIARDVTDQKRAEQEIAERGARLRQIIDTADAAIFLLDMTGRVTLANERMAEMFRTGMDVLLGSDYLDLLPPGEREQRRPHFLSMLTGRITAVDFERTFHRRDGSEFWGHMTGRHLLDPAGATRGLIGVLTDITRRKQAEAALQRTQKMDSIATLAGGIAHDFNNLLQGVFGSISMARLSLDRKDKALAMLQQAEQALQASVNLSNQLLTFSKGGKPVKAVIELQPVIENAVKFALSGSRIEHVLTLENALPAVEADAGQITQVLQNIVLNADQAMPLGGRIEISVRSRPTPGLPDLGLPSAGDVVEISVKDSGTGIPEEHLPRIFDPYFTTKEKGSGLGLATSHSIIINHGGAITVRSELGRGSTFTIYLPATAKRPDAAQPAVRHETGRKGRILLMDDEPVVRMVSSDLLRELGHEVLCAGDGTEAVARYREAKEAGTPFDVVILDLTVRGGMGGAEALQLLRSLDPQVRSIVSSGYSDDSVLANYRDLGFKAFLQKPYQIEELDAVLQGLLS